MVSINPAAPNFELGLLRNLGFAYLWVLISVALMGVGLARCGEIYATSVHRDQERQLLAIGRQFQNAMTSYRNASPVGVPHYPKSMEDLLEDRRGPVLRRHLRKIFVDPMTGQATWGEVRMGGRIVGIHSLSHVRAYRSMGVNACVSNESNAAVSAWIFMSPDEAC